MKIIAIDNFDRDIVDDVLVCENVTGKMYGECMVKALNEEFSGSDMPRFFKLVPDAYKLKKFEP